MSYPDTKELIVRHLEWIKVEQNGKTIESCLTKAFYQARTITGRNDENGQPLGDIESRKKLGWWSGAMVYIAILDQIGTIYKRTDKIQKEAEKGTKDCPIKYVLRNFTDLSFNEINAIYGLRNSFMHDFSLININKKNYDTVKENNKKNYDKVKENGHYNFELNELDEGEIVTILGNTWDGKIGTLNKQNKTIVNLKRLGDMVEDIFEELKTLHRNGDLAIQDSLENNEFQKRYFLQYQTPPK